MPRYFFHTADGGRDRDLEGVELADGHAARVEAVRYAGSLLHDSPELLWDGHDFRVEVVGEDQVLICTVIMLAVDAPEPR